MTKRKRAAVEGSAAEQPYDGHEFGKSCCSLKDTHRSASPCFITVVVEEGDGDEAVLTLQRRSC